MNYSTPMRTSCLTSCRNIYEEGSGQVIRNDTENILQLYSLKTKNLQLSPTQCLIKTLNSVNVSQDATNKNTVSKNKSKMDRQNVLTWDT